MLSRLEILIVSLYLYMYIHNCKTKVLHNWSNIDRCRKFLPKVCGMFNISVLFRRCGFTDYTKRRNIEKEFCDITGQLWIQTGVFQSGLMAPTTTYYLLRPGTKFWVYLLQFSGVLCWSNVSLKVKFKSLQVFLFIKHDHILTTLFNSKQVFNATWSYNDKCAAKLKLMNKSYSVTFPFKKRLQCSLFVILTLVLFRVVRKPEVQCHLLFQHVFSKSTQIVRLPSERFGVQ